MRNTPPKKEMGFTLAELLIVIAIIAVLVAVSIAIFADQTRKAVAATNKSNIRAARAEAMMQYFTDESSGKYKSDTSHVYYYYDVKSGKIDFNKTQYSRDNSYSSTYGTEAYNTAKNYKVCTFIIVYLAPNKGEKGAAIQTSPYYTKASGELPEKTKGGGGRDNYFGPSPGN